MFDNVSNPEYSNFIVTSRYARWLHEEKRREIWPEPVNRYINFFINKFTEEKRISKKSLEYITNELKRCGEFIQRLDVMPSMRALMTAGPALDRDHVAGYNCSFIAINRVRAFDEIMYILMCGTGVGFSVERQFVNQLPSVAERMYPTETTIIVHDSKIGWATALRELISLLYSGKAPRWDTTRVRPKGAILKTFGGRASGPEPLEDLFRFTVELFTKAVGRKLNSIEAHDLVCKIAEIVVVGGVRRSALLSLSNLSDTRMRVAKSGAWWEVNGQRALANNSVCYTETPEMGIFMQEWLSLYESKSGERGIFNREAAKQQAAKNGRRDPEHDFGTNPCSEIILRDRQFCNLSEVVVRSTDTLDDLRAKVEIAAILGTCQATLVDFRYLSQKWKDNTEEEALLGVSLTGIMDHMVLNGSKSFVEPNFIADAGNVTKYTLPLVLQELREVAIETNKIWADLLGINQATAITCVKPSGTVSQLVDSASGIHPRYSPYYIRTVRADKKDPLARLMHDMDFPCEDDVTKPETTWVFSFPMKAPEGSVFRDDRSAIEQLDLWLIYQRNWCEHKPSITVYVKENEWMEVGAWVWKHFDEVSGVSFLPHSNHSYRQAPYQEITEEEYEAFLSKMPQDVDWELLSEYEEEDHTQSAKTLACTGSVCEFVDLQG